MKKLAIILISTLFLSSCQPKQTEPKTDVFTSIKDAISKQLVLKCEYADTDGQKTITYIKGNVVRLQGTGDEANVDGLMTDGKFYLWDNTKKEGMELDINQMTADGGATMGGKPIKSIDDVVAILQEKKDSCRLSPESAGLLELPSDIKFTKTEDFFK